LRRQFSTSSGLLRLHLQSLLVTACQQLITACRSQNIDIPFPLLERWNVRRTHSELFADCLMLLAECRNVDVATGAAIRALMASAGIWGIESGTSLQNRVLADSAMLLVAREGSFEPLGVATPHLRPEIDEWLGATQLYEHMAMLQELSYRTLLGGGMAEWRSLVDADLRYSMIMRLWHHFFPQARWADVGSMRSDDVITDVYRVYPVEFYAALDLALWIPLSPNGFAGSSRPLHWEDIQPGHRFLAALSTLKNSGRDLTPVTSDEREFQFRATQRWLAARLGWPSPEVLANEWRDYLQTGGWFDDGFIIGRRDSPVMRMTATILAKRTQNAFDVVCGNVRWSESDSARFAVWMTDEGDEGCRMHGLVNDQENVRTRESYYLFRGCQVLLFGGDSHIKRLNASHRREALEVLSRDLDCDGWDPVYFREMACPYLDAEQ